MADELSYDELRNQVLLAGEFTAEFYGPLTNEQMTAIRLAASSKVWDKIDGRQWAGATRAEMISIVFAALDEVGFDVELKIKDTK